MAQRPLGVTIICILGWLGAILSILGGVALLGVGAFLGGLMGGAIGGFLSGLGLAIGAVTLIIGIADIVVLYWLWQMKKQGWTWTMIVQAISIIISLVSMSWTGIVIPAIVVIYLWMKKDLFK